MKYISTRGTAPAVGFEEALMAGLAPDGGLYSPMSWPRLAPGAIAGFAGAPYESVAAQILHPFVGEAFGFERLVEICHTAYARFSHPAVTPLKQISASSWILELFHGPSLAFKDIAMQLLAGLYDEILERRGGRLTIICATSGDTGGAAVEAFRGREHMDVVVLYPEGRISDVQRRFITSAPESNVRAFAVSGDFDACQTLVKQAFRDADFAREMNLTAVNSINIVRILAQAVYYFAAASALGSPGRKVAFAVPSGNFGDAFAGWTARAMGLPIVELLVCTNQNDILPRAFATGVYERGAVQPTQSPAMDIQVASNFERLVFEALGRDGQAVSTAFEAFEGGAALNLSESALNAIRDLGQARAVSEEETSAAMTRAFDLGLGLVDPHTAVALAASRALDVEGETPRIVLSTAHPAKFPQAVFTATGRAPMLPAQAEGLAARPERFERLPIDFEALKAALRDRPA